MWSLQRLGGACGRVTTLIALVAVVAVFVITYTLFKVDVVPQLAKMKETLNLKALNQWVQECTPGPTADPNVVPVPFDELMKAPFALPQDNPRLIELIRDRYLFPPSKESYNLKSNNDDPSMGQSKKIREILGDKKEGFFIECGALDGETRSNSLVFEKMGWSGVLIEGDPKNFELVLTKKRKAWSINACLSTFPYPNTVMFRQSFNLGKVTNIEKGSSRSGHAEVQCLPVYSILLALNTTTVDYFSLDVEGNEFEVLSSIPWDKVDIKTLSVEFAHGKPNAKENIRQFMNSKGYQVHSEVTNPMGLANDFIFVKSSLMAQTKDKKKNGKE